MRPDAPARSGAACRAARPPAVVQDVAVRVSASRIDVAQTAFLLSWSLAVFELAI